MVYPNTQTHRHKHFNNAMGHSLIVSSGMFFLSCTPYIQPINTNTSSSAGSSRSLSFACVSSTVCSCKQWMRSYLLCEARTCVTGKKRFSATKQQHVEICCVIILCKVSRLERNTVLVLWANESKRSMRTRETFRRTSRASDETTTSYPFRRNECALCTCGIQLCTNISSFGAVYNLLFHRSVHSK